MRKDIAMQWIAALRSGDYQQARHRLRDCDDAFCCLGVLCNLHAQAHPEEAKTQTRPRHYYNESIALPREVRNWSGVKTNCGMRRATGLTVGETDSLANLNDTGHTFSQIADVIEKEWRTL